MFGTAQEKEYLVKLAKNAKGMCNDCAFRKGSDANNEDFTISKVTHAILHEIPFNCHTSDLKDTGRLCKGYAEVMSKLKQED